MALSRVKTWSSGETLTASDLNAEFNNILNNPVSLVSPLTGALDLNGQELIFDADADTSITVSDDDVFDFKIGGTDGFFIGHGTGNTGAIVHVDPGAKSVTAGTDIGLLRTGNTNAITIPAGTTTVAAGIYIEAPNWTATGTITNTASLYIAGAATEGSTDYALWVDDGAVQIDSTLTVGGTVTLTTDLGVASGGTGASTFTDGGVLLGSGANAITATAVLSDGEMLVGDGTTDPALESGDTLRTSIMGAIGPDLNTLGAASSDGEVIVATGSGVFAYESGDTLRTSIMGAIGPDLNTLGAVSSDGQIIVGTGSGVFAYESGTTLRTSVGVGTGDSPTFTNLTLSGFEYRSLTNTITAGSTQTQAGATALTKEVNRVTVSGSDGDGVKLPTAVAGAMITIINDDAAQTIKVWPATSDAIDGGSANAVDSNTLAFGSSREYFAVDATNWYTVTPASSGQPADASLTDIAAITQVDGDLIMSDGTDYKAIPYRRRNLLTNGSFKIAQRSTSVAGAGGVTDTYDSFDRWQTRNISSHPGRFTISQETLTPSTDAPTAEGHRFSMKIDCTTASGGPIATGDMIKILQRIEGQEVQVLNHGDSGAKATVVSFWHKHTKTGTNVVELIRKDGTGWIAGQYTQSTSNTWEKAVVTLAGDTSTALDNNTTNQMSLVFPISAGSTYTGGDGAGTTWGTSNGERAPGQVDNLDNTANNFELAGVQWEIGSIDTPFEHLTYDEELRACRRYYEKWTPQGSQNIICVGYVQSTDVVVGDWYFDVEKRAVPTVTLSAAGTFNTQDGGACTSITVYGLDTRSGTITATNSSSPFTIKDANPIRRDGTDATTIEVIAEL